MNVWAATSGKSEKQCVDKSIVAKKSTNLTQNKTKAEKVLHPQSEPDSRGRKAETPDPARQEGKDKTYPQPQPTTSGNGKKGQSIVLRLRQ